MSELFRAVIRDRRRAWIWWAISLVFTALLITGSFTAIEGQAELNATFEDMPESVLVLMGIDAEMSLTSPAGYLNSQWFANMFPILLSIYGIGIAARVLAGEEGAGRLEVLLAHPVSRRRVLAERGWAALLLVVALGVTSSLALVLTAPAFGLDGIGAGALTAASASCVLLAMLHASVAYGVGAWTGSRGVALAAGSALMGAGFLVQSLASISDVLHPVRWLSPVFWFVDARPVVDGWGPILVPSLVAIGVSAAAIAAGTWRFERRDIGSA
jgi:ABC-2 type transport system permease protein